MTIYQYNDLPQIPSYADEQVCSVWAPEHNGHMNGYRPTSVRTSNVVTDVLDYNDFGDNGTLSMQPMQRFLYGSSPLTSGLLHAKLHHGMPLQSQLFRQYEPIWPSVDCFAYSPRNGSPDRTSVSGTSSYASQNELRSPLPFQPRTYGSPCDLSQSTLPYSPAERCDEGMYPSELPLTGGSISLREIEYQPHEPETIPEEHEQEPEPIDTRADQEHEAEPSYTKIETLPETYPNNYQSFPDSGLGNSLRDAESVQPMTLSDEEASDSDYKPLKSKRRRSSATSNTSTRHTQKRRGRKSSNVSTLSNNPKVTKRTRNSNTSPTTSKATRVYSAAETDTRPFPCPLAAYGCTSNFVSKNEWKRHVSTQHVKLGFWRCDLCAVNVDPHDDSIVYHNDFNRKDLFAQHLRRMHAAPSSISTSRIQRNLTYVVTEDNITEHQQRCYMQLRGSPQRSGCLFCDKEFIGVNSWEDRMEHVGRHLEKERKGSGSLGPERWNRDEDLERWLVTEGLVVYEGDGWRIGDGKPRRVQEVDGEE
jgi:hypothetical protein